MATPATVSGPVFIRRQDTEIHITDQGQAQYVSYRLKILQSSALQVGNISIAWNPNSGAPVVHGITVFRDGEAVDVLKTSSFEVLRREDQLEAARLDGMLTAVLHIPDLRVGDELDVAITTFASDPTLGRNESGLLMLAATPSPGRFHLGLSWDEGHKPNVKLTPDIAKAAVVSDRAIDLRFDNPATVLPPKDAPARYRMQRALEYTDFADWAAISRHFAPLYAKAATLPTSSPLKREASRIAAANADPLSRANAALKLVQQDVRYIYVGLSGGNLSPATAEETWQRRYGDCKGKTVLLLALLHEMGIDAEPVLLNANAADDGLNQRLPIPQYFDHVLVQARIDGKTYWMDGTLPPVATSSLLPIIPVNWVLPLSQQGSDLQKVEWRPAAVPEELNLMEIDARAGFDKPARSPSTSIARGVEGLKQQVQLSSLNEGQLIDGLRQQALGDTFQTIEDVKWRYDTQEGASILTIVGTGTVDWENQRGDEKLLTLPGGGFSPPERHLRAENQDQTAPFYTKPTYNCFVTTVRLPSSTQARQWSSAKSFDTHMFGREYYRAWELREGAIRMIRGSRVEQTEIDAASAQRDNARIAAFDNSMGWITYRPSSRAAAVGGGERVPATYDLDWTTGTVPCLSPATRD
jgi:hypothetical protein